MSVSIASQIQPTNLKCEQCHKNFSSIPELAEHKGLHHNKAIELYRRVVTSLEKIPCLRNQGQLGNSFS